MVVLECFYVGVVVDGEDLFVVYGEGFGVWMGMVGCVDYGVGDDEVGDVGYVRCF